ncbi:hypothetical protein BBG47_27190 [Paenibacillus sp. KS1]|uniref:DMP19 family protein n=1 Tax=Paenibacillus sp. KS1 TaxID=1849249 RepID=UPI0008065A91|nr:DUF4375 domain-containing protein [Paenibacillus sp. KS1]OBY76423.1 hypothetical protein BBG47_27190 [Paenibacillus sp. KS1]
MNNLKLITDRLLPIDKISFMSGEEIVEHIATKIYDSDFSSIRENRGILPEVLKDIILLIDFDTEMNMNGIIGFIENGSGHYFNETLEALKRIQFINDLDIMNNIKKYYERTESLLKS